MKQFIKELLWLLSEFFSLGGQGRLDDARAEYAKRYSAYKVASDRANGYRQSMHEQVLAIGNAVVLAGKLIKRAGRVLGVDMRLTRQEVSNHTVSDANEIREYSSTVFRVARLGIGGASGGALAVGSWALVAATGTASTGAAISGLSGVAASNAVLAWFGGGALAAGGAGMAGGAAVLGVVAAAPMLVLYGWGLHKNAAKYEAESSRLSAELVKIEESLPVLAEQSREISRKAEEIMRVCGAFNEHCNRLMRVILPWGVFSRIKQRILSALGLNVYNERQVAAIRELGYVVYRFASGFSYGRID